MSHDSNNQERKRVHILLKFQREAVQAFSRRAPRMSFLYDAFRSSHGAWDYFLTPLPSPPGLTQQLHQIAPGHFIYELFKNTHEIKILTFFIICCQLPLTPSLPPSLSRLSVILVMICIPEALGQSGPVPIDATCQACWVRLDWAALLFPHSSTGLLAGDFSSFHCSLLWLACTDPSPLPNNSLLWILSLLSMHVSKTVFCYVIFFHGTFWPI